jgi:4-amino-4-deoxy-L-arabinose transferase-like glycosyltransferase
MVSGAIRRAAPYVSVYVAALSVRVTAALIWRQGLATGDWQHYYRPAAASIASGDWPRIEISGEVVPAADHPPLFALSLAPLVRAGVVTALGESIALAPLAATVAPLAMWLFKLMGRSEWAWVSALLAALWPLVWAFQFQMNPEIIEVPLVIAFFLASHWCWGRPTLAKAALLGSVIGVAALAKSELAAMVVLSAPFSVAGRWAGSGRARLARLGVCVLSCLLVLSPWVIHNLTSFAEPEILSTEFGPTLLDGSCPTTFYGPFTGYADPGCFLHLPHLAQSYATDESLQDALDRQAALSYIERHLGRVPVVVAARLGRFLYLFRPLQQIHLNSCGRAFSCPGGMDWPPALAWAHLVCLWLTVPLSGAGLLMMRRMRLHVAPYVAIAALGLFVVAAFGAWTRYVGYLYADVTITASPAVATVVRWLAHHLRLGASRASIRSGSAGPLTTGS